ncbi:hypothetical protein ACHAXT_009624 [Thalassiosira profunda]
MSDPNALEVSLDTLQFKLTHREDVTSTVTLHHPGLTDQDLAFKVKTTHPRKYLVRPNEGILAPGSSTTVSILLKDKDRQALWSTFDRLGQLALDDSKDQFLVVSGAVSYEFAAQCKDMPKKELREALDNALDSATSAVSVCKKKLHVVHTGVPGACPASETDPTRMGQEMNVTELPAQKTTWTLNECSWCATNDEPLLLCGGCRQLAYCSEACQCSDWPCHTEMCGALLCMEDEDNEREEAIAPILFVSLTHAGYVCPGKKKPEGIPTNFGLYQAAERFFRVKRTNVTYIENFQVPEDECRALYQDLTIHKDEWVTFFRHLENSRHFVTAFNALYILADAYMTRGLHDECKGVSEWWKENASDFAELYQHQATQSVARARMRAETASVAIELVMAFIVEAHTECGSDGANSSKAATARAATAPTRSSIALSPQDKSYDSHVHGLRPREKDQTLLACPAGVWSRYREREDLSAAVFRHRSELELYNWDGGFQCQAFSECANAGRQVLNARRATVDLVLLKRNQMRLAKAPPFIKQRSPVLDENLLGEFEPERRTIARLTGSISNDTERAALKLMQDELVAKIRSKTKTTASREDLNFQLFSTPIKEETLSCSDEPRALPKHKNVKREGRKRQARERKRQSDKTPASNFDDEDSWFTPSDGALSGATPRPASDGAPSRASECSNEVSFVAKVPSSEASQLQPNEASSAAEEPSRDGARAGRRARRVGTVDPIAWTTTRTTNGVGVGPIDSMDSAATSNDAASSVGSIDSFDAAAASNDAASSVGSIDSFDAAAASNDAASSVGSIDSFDSFDAAAASNDAASSVGSIDSFDSFDGAAASNDAALSVGSIDAFDVEDSGQKLRFVVKTLAQSEHPFQASATEAVSSLKQRLADEEFGGEPPQRLMLNGESLREDCTLQEAGVKNGDVLYYVLSFRAEGTKRPSSSGPELKDTIADVGQPGHAGVTQVEYLDVVYNLPEGVNVRTDQTVETRRFLAALGHRCAEEAHRRGLVGTMEAWYRGYMSSDLMELQLPSELYAQQPVLQGFARLFDVQVRVITASRVADAPDVEYIENEGPSRRMIEITSHLDDNTAIVCDGVHIDLALQFPGPPIQHVAVNNASPEQKKLSSRGRVELKNKKTKATLTVKTVLKTRVDRDALLRAINKHRNVSSTNGELFWDRVAADVSATVDACKAALQSKQLFRKGVPYTTLSIVDAANACEQRQGEGTASDGRVSQVVSESDGQESGSDTTGTTSSAEPKQPPPSSESDATESDSDDTYGPPRSDDDDSGSDYDDGPPKRKRKSAMSGRSAKASAAKSNDSARRSNGSARRSAEARSNDSNDSADPASQRQQHHCPPSCEDQNCRSRRLSKDIFNPEAHARGKSEGSQHKRGGKPKPATAKNPPKAAKKQKQQAKGNGGKRKGNKKQSQASKKAAKGGDRCCTIYPEAEGCQKQRQSGCGRYCRTHFRERLPVQENVYHRRVLAASRIWHAAEHEPERYRAFRDRVNKRMCERYHTDPDFRLGLLLRSRLRYTLKEKFKTSYKGKSELVGCTPRQLRLFIEQQFKDWMNWENHGRPAGCRSGWIWELEHIKPVKKFDLNNEEDLKQMNHWSNLMPLHWKINAEKGSKYDEKDFRWCPERQRFWWFNGNENWELPADDGDGDLTWEEIDNEEDDEFCAIHLATLCESALRNLDESDGGAGQFRGFDYYVNIMRLQLDIRARSTGKGSFRESVAVFRDVCVFEARTSSEFPEFMRDNKRTHLAQLQKSRKVSLKEGIPPADEIRALPPRVLIKCLKRCSEKLLPPKESQTGKVAECLKCKVKEKVPCEFPVCGNCRDAVFCSRDCQRASWSEHKKTCGKWVASGI